MAVWAQTVADSFPDVYGYGGLLAGRDRRAAEELVRDAYSRLADAGAEAVADGSVVRSLRSLMRRRWLDRLAGQEPARRARAGGDRRVIADLPDHVRVLVVLVAVDGMTQSRVARLTGVAEGDVDRLVAQARGWLGVEESADRRTWVRGFLGDEVTPPVGLVDELVALAPPRWAQPSPVPSPVLSPPVTSFERSAVFEAVPATGDAWPDETDPAGLAALVGMDDREAQPIVPATELVDTVDIDDDGDGGSRPSWPWGGVGSLPRWVPAAAAVLLLVIVVSVVATRGSGSGGTVTGAGTGVSVSSTVASSSSVGSTSTPSSVATTDAIDATSVLDRRMGEVERSDAFNPACVRRIDDTPMPTISEKKAAIFGPLTARATLTLNLPHMGRSTDVPASAYAYEIPGGVVVGFGDGEPYGASMEAVVGVDGKVRSIRCFEYSSADPSAPEVTIDPSLDYPLPPAFPYRPSFTCCDETSGLEVEDSAVVAWTDETLHNVEYDDHAAYVVGSPTNPSIVAAGCTAVSLQPILEGGVATGESRYDCTEDSRVLRVYAAADGTVVHEVPGVWTVYVASEHFALVQTADADRMVDLDAAAFVDGQSWPRGTFTKHSDSSVSTGAKLVGGIVTNYANGTLTIWFPKSLGLASHAVSLS